MLLADISAEGWSVIIAAAVFGLERLSVPIREMYRDKIKADSDERAHKEKMAQLEAVEKKADIVAEKVEKVAEVLQEKTSIQDEKLDSIHTLVNSSMGAQLKIAAVALRRLADKTVGDPGHEDDKEAASVAERLLAEHVAKQADVDASK